MRIFIQGIFVFLSLSVFAACSFAQDGEGAITIPDEEVPSVEDAPSVTLMTPERMEALVKSFDEEAEIGGNGIAFTLEERNVLIVYDVNNNRMRIMSPIAPAELLDEEMLMRMSQANFDAVLDARYAIANDLLWSTFIHPLGSLQKEDFISAIAQVVTAAETFGTTYTSGAMVFGGGDSSALHDELLEELEEAIKKKGDAI